MASEKEEMLTSNDHSSKDRVTRTKAIDDLEYSDKLVIQLPSTGKFGEPRITKKNVSNYEALPNFYRKSIITGSIQLICGVIIVIIDGVYISGDQKYRVNDTSIVFGETSFCFLAAVFTFIAGRFSRMALHVTCMVFCLIGALGSTFTALLLGLTDVRRELGDAVNHVDRYQITDKGMMTYIKTPENELLWIKNHHASLFIARCIFLLINAISCVVQASFCCRLTCCRPKIQVNIIYSATEEKLRIE